MKSWFASFALVLLATAGAAEEKRDTSIILRNEKPAMALQLLEHFAQAKVTTAPEVDQLQTRVSLSITHATTAEAVLALLQALRKAGIQVERTENGYHATLVPTSDPPAPHP
jgi:hypothetical protein